MKGKQKDSQRKMEGIYKDNGQKIEGNGRKMKGKWKENARKIEGK